MLFYVTGKVANALLEAISLLAGVVMVAVFIALGVLYLFGIGTIIWGGWYTFVQFLQKVRKYW